MPFAYLDPGSGSILGQAFIAFAIPLVLVIAVVILAVRAGRRRSKSADFTCPRCGAPVASDALFCGACGLRRPGS